MSIPGLLGQRHHYDLPSTPLAGQPSQNVYIQANAHMTGAHPVPKMISQPPSTPPPMRALPPKGISVHTAPSPAAPRWVEVLQVIPPYTPASGVDDAIADMMNAIFRHGGLIFQRTPHTSVCKILWDQRTVWPYRRAVNFDPKLKEGGLEFKLWLWANMEKVADVYTRWYEAAYHGAGKVKHMEAWEVGVCVDLQGKRKVGVRLLDFPIDRDNDKFDTFTKAMFTRAAQQWALRLVGKTQDAARGVLTNVRPILAQFDLPPMEQFADDMINVEGVFTPIPAITQIEFTERCLGSAYRPLDFVVEFGSTNNSKNKVIRFRPFHAEYFWAEYQGQGVFLEGMSSSPSCTFDSENQSRLRRETVDVLATLAGRGVTMNLTTFSNYPIENMLCDENAIRWASAIAVSNPTFCPRFIGVHAHDNFVKVGREIHSSGKYDFSIGFCDYGMKQFGTTPQLLRLKADGFARKKDYPSAFKFFKQAELVLDQKLDTTEQAKLLVSIGCTLKDMGKYNEALPLIDKACKLLPDSSIAWFNAAQVNYNIFKQVKDKRYADQACDCCKRALKIDPNYKNAKGLLLMIQG